MLRTTVWNPSFQKLVICLLVLMAVGPGTSFNNKNSKDGLPMNWFEQKVKEQIERFREVMRTGSPALGIPVLDPYTIKKELINFNTSFGVGSLDVQDFSAGGLSSFYVEDVRVSLTNLSTSVRFKWTGIKSTGKYKLGGKLAVPYLGDLPLYGEGPVKALIHELWIDIKLKFTTTENAVKASSLEVSWDIVNPQVRVDGLYGGMELGNTINDLVEDLIPKLDAAYHDALEKKIEDLGLTYINKFLSGVKPEDPQNPFIAMLEYSENAL